MSALDLDALAREVKAAQDSGSQYVAPTARHPGFTMEAGYEVAARIHRMRLAEGARPVGRKIGFTNPDMWKKFGVREPAWAYVYDTTVEMLGGTQASSAPQRFAEPKIEPEIVLHFRFPPPPGAGPVEIAASIDWVAHGFEIVQSHAPGWKFRAPDTVADWVLHGRLFVGPRVPIGQLGVDPVKALREFRLTLWRDGEPMETARGANVLGSPLMAIRHITEVIQRQPASEPISAGELVTTGTITTALSVNPGERWHTTLEGVPLPGLEIEFTR